jgi:glycosyltransferase involved in cell wall biosynthesis
MRILEVIRSLDPTGGGPVEGLRQLAAVMAGRGHDVEVVSLDKADQSFLRSYSFPIHALGETDKSYGFAKGFVPWLKANARRFDLVLIDGLWQYHSFGTWRALRNSGVPYLVFTHGMLDPWFKRTYPLKHLKKWLYWPWAEYRVLRDASAVLFTCEEERLLARESFWLYKANERVVSYGAAVPEADAETQRSEFLARYPELMEKRICLFLGRIHPKKGCDLLLKAFAESQAFLDPQWRLVMAGPDQIGWKHELDRLANALGISSKVVWTGALQGDLKWGAMHAAETFILPSHQENFGVAVAEALGCRLPVLISDKVNIWREISSDGAGFVSGNSVAQIVGLLKRWNDSSEEAKAAMRTAALRCYESRFTFQRAAELLENELSRVVRKRTQPPVAESAVPA